MKRFVMAIALACILSGSALAGDMPTGGIAAPTNPATQATSAVLPADVPTVGTAEQISSVALSALLTIFDLLSV